MNDGVKREAHVCDGMARCPPKVSLSWWHHWEEMAPLGGAAWKEEAGHWPCAFEGDVGP